MRTEHYIGELLYRYNCVVIPEFGAFLTQMKSAFIEDGTNTFHPPSKIISFNSQLTNNDGLLVSTMASSEDITYEEMLSKILKVSEEWKNNLRLGERLMLSNIGELWLNRENKIQFQPSSQINYLTSSFGLTSFITPPVIREVLKEKVVALEENVPFIITPEERKQGNFRPYLKYAAILLLAFSTGVTGYRLYEQQINTRQIVREQAQEAVSRYIQEATFFNSAPLELPPLRLKATKRSTANHYIIAGAFRVRKNADKKVRQLKRSGFEAQYLGVNKYGLHQVTYGSFVDAEKALEFLKKIKRTQTRDAWMLSTK